MKRNWTAVGERTGVSRALVALEIERLDWHSTDDRAAAPACQALAINHVVEQIGLKNISAVAWNGTVEGNPLYGIEAGFADGSGRIYVLDLGDRAVVVATDFWPAPVAAGL